MAKETKKFTIADLNSAMNKNSQFGGLLSEGSVSKITEYIHTGNYMLNASCCGSLFGGIPNNRSVCLSGESGVGKTFLLLNICREAQKMGYFVVFYDSENAVDEDLAKGFGVDPALIRYEPVQTIQEFRSNVTSLIDTLLEEKKKGNEIPKLFIALDSAGNLATQKEIDDAKAYSDKSDMSRAKMMKSVIRIMMSKLGIIGGSFVFTNHIYKSLDLYARDIQAGGTGVVYGASLILNLSKSKIKDGTTQTGIKVTAKPDKNRFCKPMPVSFHINYERGMNPYIGLEEYMKWELCGVGRGKFLTAKEYAKLSDGDKAKCFQHPMDAELYFQPNENARSICTSHSVEPFALKEWVTPKVWTNERLAQLDEYIKKLFAYSKAGDEETAEEMLAESEGMEDEN